MNIPVYRWENGVPVLTPLTDFEPTPLKTYYLQRNYGGDNEPKYHLVDEPFDYPSETISVGQSSYHKTDVWGGRKRTAGVGFNKGGTSGYTGSPDAYVLGQNFPNPFNPTTFIEYHIPRDGNVKIEIFSESGQLVDVLVDKWHMRGVHVLPWNAKSKASGIYFYRFMTDDFQATRKMVLVR